MMKKEYTANSRLVTARPRSERLRHLGGTIVNVSGGTVVSGGSSGGQVVVSGGDGHTHANKADLDAINIDRDGYGYITRTVETTDEETGETDRETVTEKVKAGYADKAHDLDEDSPVNDRFLSKIADDVAAGKITFQQGLIAVGISVFQDEAHFGTFVKSLYGGTGAGVDPKGNAEFESVRVRTYFETVELIINRLSAMEGEYLFTESDTIDSVVNNGDGTYGLYLHSQYDGYITAQAAGNVLKGIVNNLGAAALGVTSDLGAAMYTSWMRVNSVNATSNYIEVTLYPDDEVPSGKNYPPCKLMRIARWGNQTDTARQSCFLISSTDGRILHLTGVIKPILENYNYGASFGVTPDFLKAMNLPLRDDQDYVYVRGLIAQDIIRIDYSGKPIVEYVDRGAFNETAKYYCEAKNADTGIWETSDVWYKGCKWRCMVTGTHEAPSYNSTSWAMVEGNPDFTVEFADTDYLFDPDHFAVTLQIVARLYNLDVTGDILDTDVVWTRYSEDADGNERVSSDNAWALKRAGAGKAIDLDTDDIDFNGYVPKTVKFTATVTLRDGAGDSVGTDSATFEY